MGGNCCIINESEMNKHIERLALIAQLVEQRTENPRVTGSIPVQGIQRDIKYLIYMFAGVVQW